MTDIPPPPPNSALPPPPPPTSVKWYSKKAGPLPVWAWIAAVVVVLGAIGSLAEEPSEDTSADVASEDTEARKESVEAEVPEEDSRQSLEPEAEASGNRCERDDGSVASEGSTSGQGPDRVRCEDGVWVAFPTSDPVYTTTTRPESTLAVGADDLEETDSSVATTTAAPPETTPPPTTSPPTTAPPATSSETSAQRDAVDTARSYLRFMSFSRQGLIEQLEYEGFATSDATYGVDAQNADWFQQAVLTAENYLDVMSFSRTGLIDQLIYEGFTPAEATHGADTAFASTDASGGGETASQANARESAASYLSFMAFSRTGLIDQLEYEGYSTADATYGVDAQGADWNQQAALKAEEYLDFMSFTRSELIDQLLYEGFSQSEATYGANTVGL